jgi:hypothetical protein
VVSFVGFGPQSQPKHRGVNIRLAEMQRALRDILRSPDVSPSADDPELSAYLDEVNKSGRVQVLTHIMQSWRVYDLERACPLTAAALHSRGYWESTLEYFNVEAHSPFVERLAGRFLDVASEHVDPLVASVARFERAYGAVVRGSEERFVVRWDREPAEVLTRLVTRMPLDDLHTGGTYLTNLARDLPNLFEISIAPP